MQEKEIPDPLLSCQPKEQLPPEDEFDPYYQEHPEKVTEKQLNNFHFNLPCGFNRILLEKNQDELILEKKTRNLQKRGRSEEEIAFELKKISQIRLKQTDREFFAAIDKAIEECDREAKSVSAGENPKDKTLIESLAELNKLIQDQTEASSKKIVAGDFFNSDLHKSMVSTVEKIRSLSLPIYQKLREWGYNHKELIL